MTEKQVFLEARNKLAADGWAYWFPPRTWGERDIMGAFDFIAARGKKVILVQLTTIQHISDRRRKIRDFYLSNKLGPLPGAFIWAFDPKKGRWKTELVR